MLALLILALAKQCLNTLKESITTSWKWPWTLETLPNSRTLRRKVQQMTCKNWIRRYKRCFHCLYRWTISSSNKLFKAQYQMTCRPCFLLGVMIKHFCQSETTAQAKRYHPKIKTLACVSIKCTLSWIINLFQMNHKGQKSGRLWFPSTRTNFAQPKDQWMHAKTSKKQHWSLICKMKEERGSSPKKMLAPRAQWLRNN